MSEKFSSSFETSHEHSLHEVKREVAERLETVERTLEKKIRQIQIVSSWFPNKAKLEVEAEVDQLKDLHFAAENDTQELEQLAA